jgi:hypothetical protein
MRTLLSPKGCTLFSIADRQQIGRRKNNSLYFHEWDGSVIIAGRRKAIQRYIQIFEGDLFCLNPSMAISL